MVGVVTAYYHSFYDLSYRAEQIRYLIANIFQPTQIIFGLFILEWVLTKRISIISKWILVLLLLTNILAHIFTISRPFGIVFMGMFVYYGFVLYKNRQKVSGAIWAVVFAATVPAFGALAYVTIHKYSFDLFNEYDKLITCMLFLFSPLFLLIYVSIRFREVLDDVSVEAAKVIEVTEEKRAILENQNVVLESQVEKRTAELAASLTHLKSTQSQLIQAEKMASLGELTAGIAHEIQNPLNFVNNFSEVSNELIGEIEEERAKSQEARDETLVSEILQDVKSNLEKINHHGKREDAIVKGMLEHSRKSTGEKVPTDLNALADEYLRLSYHGLRAKDKSFNADFNTDFDPNLPQVNVVSQDIGRVILNPINNAFYAASRRDLPGFENLEGLAPKVIVSTKNLGEKIQISISDNGSGIPNAIKDKIFQPFFTTKPTGSGTGLGLSLSYDIIKAHGGDLRVKSIEGEGTEMIFFLPIV
jgi:signal transduction histidine kinase